MYPTTKLYFGLARCAALFLLVFCCLSHPSHAQEPVAGKAHIKINRAVKVLVDPTTQAYSINYKYNCPGHTRVHIANLGFAPASGQFSYLTKNQSLDIDAEDGTRLASIPIRETIVSASKPPLNEIANEIHFPTAYRAYRWRDRVALLPTANSVLGRYFRYFPSERDGRTFIVTTFAPLEVPASLKGVVGQIAVLLSFPYNSEGGSYDFHVQFLVREGRTHSDEFRPTSSTELLHAGDAFVNQLIDDMLKGGTE